MKRNPVVVFNGDTCIGDVMEKLPYGFVGDVVVVGDLVKNQNDYDKTYHFRGGLFVMGSLQVSVTVDDILVVAKDIQCYGDIKAMDVVCYGEITTYGKDVIVVGTLFADKVVWCGHVTVLEEFVCKEIERVSNVFANVFSFTSAKSVNGIMIKYCFN